MKLKSIIIISSICVGIALITNTFYGFSFQENQNNIKSNLAVTNQNPKNTKTYSGVIQTYSGIQPNFKCIKASEGVKIYTYVFHYIIPDKFVDPKNQIEYGNSLSPEFFEGVLKKVYNERLIGNIEVINLQELEQYYKNDCYPNKNIVILTADDGWDDNYNYLFPLAKKYNIPFNLAIISGKVSKTPAEINNFANEYEIREMLNSGLIQLASHTVDHFDLRRIDIKQKEHQICDSKVNLEKLFNIRINSLVYPSGKFDPDSEILAKKCGYSFAFSTGYGPFKASVIKSKPYEITRIRINRKTIINNIFRSEDKTTSTGSVNPSIKK